MFLLSLSIRPDSISFSIILSFASGGICQESRQVMLLAGPVKGRLIMLPDGFLAQRTQSHNLQRCGSPGVYAITGSVVTSSNASLFYPILVAGVLKIMPPQVQPMCFFYLCLFVQMSISFSIILSVSALAIDRVCGQSNMPGYLSGDALFLSILDNRCG